MRALALTLTLFAASVNANELKMESKLSLESLDKANPAPSYYDVKSPNYNRHILGFEYGPVELNENRRMLLNIRKSF